MIREYGFKINNLFTRNIFVDNDDDPGFIRKHGDTDIYKTIYLYDSSDIKESMTTAPLYFDIDSPDLERSKQQACLLFSALQTELLVDAGDIDVYFSGSKGFHVLIDPVVLSIPPLKTTHELYKKWAIHFMLTYGVSCIDLKIYDKRRLFRIVNTRNSKSGLYKIYITRDELFAPIDTVLSLAKQPRELFAPKKKRNTRATIQFLTKCEIIATGHKKKKTFELERRDILPCIAQTISTGTDSGSRNNTGIVIANSLYQCGLTDDEVDAKLEEWNDNNTPPLPEYELKTIIRSARQMTNNGYRYGCSYMKEIGACDMNVPCRVRGGAL